MDKPIHIPRRMLTRGNASALNEKLVAAFGIVAFLISVAASITMRLSLEATERGAVPAKAEDRALVKGDVLIPVTLSIKFANGETILRGTVPDEKARDTVVTRAMEHYGPAKLSDNLSIEPGIVLTPWFDSVLKWFPPKIDQLSAGEISVSGMNVLLFGQVSDKATRSAAESVLVKLAGPEGRVVNELQVAPLIDGGAKQ